MGPVIEHSVKKHGYSHGAFSEKAWVQLWSIESRSKGPVMGHISWGGLWRIMADYGGLWRIMAWRIMAD